MTMRELGILARLPEGHPNRIPEPPPALAEAGEDVLIEYESEATTMQREAETGRVRVWFEDLELIKTVTGDPTVGMVANGHEAARWLSEARQVPAEVVSSKREVKAAVDQIEAAQAEAERNEALPNRARAMKDMAQAEAVATA